MPTPSPCAGWWATPVPAAQFLTAPYFSLEPWVEYEGIQSDIFDHIFAVLPKFGLRAFQGGTVEAAASRGLSINEPEI